MFARVVGYRHASYIAFVRAAAIAVSLLCVVSIRNRGPSNEDPSPEAGRISGRRCAREKRSPPTQGLSRSRRVPAFWIEPAQSLWVQAGIVVRNTLCDPVLDIIYSLDALSTIRVFVIKERLLKDYWH